MTLVSRLLLASLTLLSTCLAEIEKVAVRNIITQDPSSKLALSSVNKQPYHFLPPVHHHHNQGEQQQEELELLDICLVASVDGKFHALNRSSGQVLWSMGSGSGSSSVTTATDHPAALGPLVRTQHVDPDPNPLHDDAADGETKELYIIEPQSGDIYVLPKPDEPLQRLPFSMSQLVDMSPFSFVGDDENRVFVGKKETSLLILELETGRLRGTVNANSECPWDPFFGFEEEGGRGEEVDLDELDGTKPPKVKPVSTEVLIGRTDYHVSIHTRPRNPSEPRPPIQNLTFSTYGPNNQDLPIQSTYRRTPDDMYIQPTSAGEIMSFRTSPSNDHDHGERSTTSVPLWGVSFKSPIVAVFDVLQAPDRPNPIALLQPQPRLQDFIPNFHQTTSGAGGGDGELELDVGATYVGMVRENGALYALSPGHYPLAIFARPNYRFVGRRGRLAIDAPRPISNPPSELDSDGDGDGDAEKELRDLPMSVDDVRRLLKERARCTAGTGSGGGKWDRSCVVGARPVAAAGQSRLSRLLPDRPYEQPVSREQDAPMRFGSGAGNEVGNGTRMGIESDRVQPGRFGTFGGSVLAFAIFLVGLWYLSRKKTRAGGERRAVEGVREQPERSAEVRVVDFGESKPLPALPETSPATQSDAGPSTSTSNSEDFVIIPRPPPNPATSLEAQGPQSDKVVANEGAEDVEGDEDSGHEGDNAVVPGKKRGTRRRKRGKKGKGNAAGANGEVPVGEAKEGGQEGNGEAGVPSPIPGPSTLTPSPSTQDVPSTQQLVVSDEVLGYGSHGTVVYRGSLQGRAVAVKRLLKDFVTLASREVTILQESDDHPNVIRYYYQESHQNFLYIALELCPASLADVIEHPDAHRELSNAFEPKRALEQVAKGVRHLHALKIVHRDIKPQNILISAAKRGAGPGTMAGHRMLISDFGLCKRLEVDQTSFLPTVHGAGVGAGAAGTVGWRAPEILRGEVNLEETTVDDSSRGSSVGTTVIETAQPTQTNKMTRLTKSVDIFALGCLFYYILTSGGHPYGDRYEREANILKDAKDLSALEAFGEEGLEAVDLIGKMLDPDPSKRPDTTTCLIHPFFWTPARRLSFLQDASDRFEIMSREPRDPDLIELENDAFRVVGNDWQSRLDKVFLENLGKFRKYDGRSVQDLMRALRNKKHHYQDLPENVKRHLGSLPDGFLSYFTRRFPHLFMHVHSVVSRTNLRYESMFKTYFELLE